MSCCCDYTFTYNFRRLPVPGPTPTLCTFRKWSNANPPTVLWSRDTGSSVRGLAVDEQGYVYVACGVTAFGNTGFPEITVTTTQGGGTGANEEQTVTLHPPPSGGTFTLTFDGQTTGAIAHNANAAAIESALESLSNIGAGNVSVTCPLDPGGTIDSFPMLVEFVGTLALTNVAQMTGNTTNIQSANVHCYAPNGGRVWSKRIGPSAGRSATGCFYRSGGLYVGLTLDTGAGDNHATVYRLNPTTGDTVWSAHLQNADGDAFRGANSVYADSAGRVIAAVQTPSFGTPDFRCVQLFDAGGGFVWDLDFPHEGPKAVIDDDGSPYVVHRRNVVPQPWSAQGWDNGNPPTRVWTFDHGTHLECIDHLGAFVYVGGETGSGGDVRKLAKSDGSEAWGISFGTCHVLAANEFGVYLGGNGSSSIRLVLDSDGSTVWTVDHGLNGGSSAQVFGLAVDGAGFVHVGGNRVTT